MYNVPDALTKITVILLRHAH